MYWNTVQVVNCTIQNTQAICLWNVKKALIFSATVRMLLLFGGSNVGVGGQEQQPSELVDSKKSPKIYCWKSSNLLALVLLLEFFDILGMFPSLFTCVQETSKPKWYFVPTLLTCDHYLRLRKLHLNSYNTFFRESKISLALVYKSSWYLHRKYTIQIVRFLDTSLALAGHSSSLQYEPCEGHPKLTQRSKHRRYSRLDF